jgi:hexosaminidase
MGYQYSAVIILSMGFYTVYATSVWPLPLNMTSTGRVFYFRHHHFRWECAGRESALLSDAFDRYHDIIFKSSIPKYGLTEQLQRDAVLETLDRHAAIEGVEVHVVSSDQSLGLQTSETYSLRVSAPKIIITSTTVYGALRALETLAQLTFAVDDVDEKTLNRVLDAADVGSIERHRHHHHHRHHRHRKHRRNHSLVLVNETAIFDTPRFRWRGLLIDTARHYLPVGIIKAHLDAMAMVKLNVLHWHLVDDQSFPYASKRFPEISEEGAFSTSMTYSGADVAEIVTYARARGIRVMPEFDTPGHVASWGLSHPELLTRCFDSDGSPTGELGPIDPSKPETYTLLWQLLREAAGWFPDAFVHLGGDEVDTSCWKVR